MLFCITNVLTGIRLDIDSTICKIIFSFVIEHDPYYILCLNGHSTMNLKMQMIQMSSKLCHDMMFDIFYTGIITLNTMIHRHSQKPISTLLRIYTQISTIIIINLYIVIHYTQLVYTYKIHKNNNIQMTPTRVFFVCFH